MVVFFTFFIILALSFVGLVIYSSGGSFNTCSADFFAKGSEAGLSLTEIKTLKRAADYLRMEKPLLILGSMDHVDNAINKISHHLEHSGYRDSDAIDILENLFKYRKKVEIKKIERKSIVISSREIDEGQRVKVTLGSNYPPINGVVMTNSPDALVIDFSSDTNLNSNIVINGPVNVYFWKKDDAGYYFETIVIDYSLGKKWKVAHSNKLIRSQKRENIRKDIATIGYILKLENISKRNDNPIGSNGTIVQLKNLSESGIAFYINGKVPKSTPLKIEFDINGKKIVVCGFVKESIYNEVKGISLIRFIFIEPGIAALTVIREFLYNLKNENIINEISKGVENEVELYKNVDIDDTELDTVAEVEYLPEDNEVFI